MSRRSTRKKRQRELAERAEEQKTPGTVGVSVEQTIEATHFSGPVPSPAAVREFAEILPSAPERIFGMAEREQAHRHAMACAAVQRERLGQIFAFTLALLIAMGGFALVWSGRDAQGFALILAGAGTLGANFLYLQRQRRETPNP